MTTDSLALSPDLSALADRFFGAVIAKDLETVKECYAPDVRVWHHFDNYEQTRDENLQQLTWVVNTFTNFRYEEIRRRPVDGGFIQQHVMRGEGPDGKPFEAPTLVLVTVTDGLITRIEEYFDTGQVPLS